jgi:hypothetical protein
MMNMRRLTTTMAKRTIDGCMAISTGLATIGNELMLIVYFIRG